ncbi:MAG: PD-(D/E)XK nuclease family protein, partial [Flavobacteriales bacterium]
FIAFLNGDETRVSQGKNWLTLKMATRLVINTLEEDLKTVIEQQLPIEIIQLETPLKADMRITNQGQERILHWIGYVDRIDKIGEVFRIIDYKTGIVKDNDVEFSVKDDLLESFSKTKHALQLMVYSFLFKQNFGFFPTQSLIFSLPTQTAIQKALNTGEISDHERMQLLNEFVTLIMDQLFDKETPLEHNPEAYYCKFC